MNQSPTYSELQGLLDLLCRGAVTPAEIQRIQQLALVSCESRSFFIQYMQMHGALAWQYRDTPLHAGLTAVAGGSPVLGFLGMTGAPAMGAHKFLHLWPLAVGVALCFWAFWAYVIQSDRQHLTNRPAATSAARLKQIGARCRWGHATPPDVGDDLAIGKILRLEAGQLELAFASGAHGILEGPAEFEILSRNGGYLSLGKLTALVPQSAIGFAVETPTARIVDLGTEFGVEVDSTGETGVQVFMGAVDFTAAGAAKTKQAPASPPARRLEAGQSAQTAGAAKEIVAASFPPGKFTRQIHPPRRLQREVPVDLSAATATQSSLYTGGGQLPQEAIDGDPTTYSVTSDEVGSAAWWRLDLGQSRSVSAVVLHNDLSQRGWLRDITIKLLADDGTTIVGQSPMLNPKNSRGGGEEDFDDGPLRLSFDFPRERGEPPIGRFLLVEREPCTLEPSRMKTKRGSGFLAGCRAALVLGEVDVFELQDAADTTGVKLKP